MTDMTEQELRKKIKIGPTELVQSSSGAIDIFAVKGGKVTYGFLISGGRQSETIEDFLAHFKTDK
jgi:hypothetical protein